MKAFRILNPDTPRRSGDSSNPESLPLLDAGRFAAAALVMLFHYTSVIKIFFGEVPLYGVFRGGNSGVEYFFVLSGFIIVYVHRRDLGQRSQVSAFLAKRFIRIFPMLWLMLIVWGTFRILFSSYTTLHHTGVLNIFVDMLLLPHNPPFVLDATWTLTREFIFYSLFSVIIYNFRVGVFTLLIWQCGVIAYSITLPTLSPWPTAVFDTYNLGFGLGMLIGLTTSVRAPGRILAYLVTAVGGIAFAILLGSEWHYGFGLPLETQPFGRINGPILYLIAASVLVFGLVSIDRNRTALKSALLGYAGGCSYVLYLIHGPLGSISIRLFKHAELPPVGKLLIMAAIAIAVALVVHVFVEKPVVKLLRAQLSRPKPPLGDTALPEPIQRER